MEPEPVPTTRMGGRVVSNSQNPEVQRREGGPMEEFSITPGELAMFEQAYGGIPERA
ncbi:hypothetical protein GCM10010466_04850 [Planomonospora alba]|uniref:Uncharacterized protein n=1 Tax=Planomonospora alba TaxID=161354 RepID=A0ABP6MJM8_9ACTN